MLLVISHQRKATTLPAHHTNTKHTRRSQRYQKAMEMGEMGRIYVYVCYVFSYQSPACRQISSANTSAKMSVPRHQLYIPIHKYNMKYRQVPNECHNGMPKTHTICVCVLGFFFLLLPSDKRTKIEKKRKKIEDMRESENVVMDSDDTQHTHTNTLSQQRAPPANHCVSVYLRPA